MRKRTGRGQLMNKSLLNPRYCKTDFGRIHPCPQSPAKKTAAHRIALLLCSDIIRMCHRWRLPFMSKVNSRARKIDAEGRTQEVRSGCTFCSLCQQHIFQSMLWSIFWCMLAQKKDCTIKWSLRAITGEIGMPMSKEEQETTAGRTGWWQDEHMVSDRPSKVQSTSGRMN